MIKSHAKVSHLYRTKYQPGQKGRIGITISSDWVVPIDDSEEAKLMAQRKLDYFFGVVSTAVASEPASSQPS
jgi:beta-glucosidase